MAFSLSDMFSFNPDGSYKPAGDFVKGRDDIDNSPDLMMQSDTGGMIGWSLAEQARRDAIDNAYYAQKNGATTTDFSHGIPSQLGSDVYGPLAMGGVYSNNGNTVQFNPDQGNLLVSNPGGKYVSYYDPSGKFQRAGASGNTMSPLQGLAAVAGAATGFGALGTLAAGGSLGLGAGLSAASMVPKALMPAIAGGPQITSTGGQSSNSNGTDMAINATPSTGGLFGQGGMFGGGSGSLDGIISQLGGLGNIGAQLIPGLVGANQQTNAGQSMIDFLNNQQNTMQQQGQTAHQGVMDFINGQQSKIDNLYNPGTPEANLMQQQMDAKDAAAGRNSQYGTRSVELAGKLAGLKGGLDAQFAGSAIPAVNSSFNQAASNTNSFTQGTSRALADALGVRSGAFNSLLSGMGALNQRNQTGGIPGGGSGGGSGMGFSGLSGMFNNTFGGGFSGGSDSLTGLGVDGSVPFGSGFNFSNPILDSNGIGSIGSAGGTGINFGGFGNSLGAFANNGGDAFGNIPDVSKVLDWFNNA